MVDLPSSGMRRQLPAAAPPRPAVAPPRPEVPAKSKPALSLSMTPDVYGARLKEDRDAAFALEEKAMTERQAREKDLLTKRHAAEKASLDQRREGFRSRNRCHQAVRRNVETSGRRDDGRFGSRDGVFEKPSRNRARRADQEDRL